GSFILNLPPFRSLDHLVGAAGERQRDCDAERPGGLEVEKEFNFGGLLNRQIGGLIAPEKSPRVSGHHPGGFLFTAAIRHQTTGGGKPTKFVDRGHCVANCQVGELFAVSSEEVVWADDERACV